MTELDVAWAAGLFEGEGSISVTSVKNRRDSIKVQVSISMTDQDVLERFCEIIGIGKIKGPYAPRSTQKKERYLWEVQNQQGCVEVVKKLFPYLGLRRKQQARKLINTIEARIDKQ